MGTFKKTVLFLHRWLGFLSGLAVFIVSITGCIYCFQDDIQDALFSYRKVALRSAALLAPSTFREKSLKKYPGGRVTLIVYYGPERSMQVRMQYKKKSIAVFYDPYTAAFLHAEELENNFFAFIKKVHLYLFLPKVIGKLVNGISVITFMVIMISGLVLWWPKRSSDRKRCFTIKWRGRWRRVNYDLHNVLGFYVTFFAMILAITGLSYSFSWMRSALYISANGGKIYPSELRTFHSATLGAKGFPDSLGSIDRAYRTVREMSPAAVYLLISPGGKADAPITVTAYPRVLHFSHSDIYSFDRNSGKILGLKADADKSNGAKLNAMNYDIHTGQIAGIFGKIMAFLVSLVCASLPLTGLIVYLGRKKPIRTGGRNTLTVGPGTTVAADLHEVS